MTGLPGGPSPESDADLTRTSATSTSPADAIGPYRLLQKLGEGGMGEVWLAEQTQPIRRQVALKVIKAGMDTAHVVARFEAERQALSLMDHSAIARVFEAGTTAQGRPYFVMELVRGEPITTYCDRHQLSTRERIDLFLQVCDGVQHAHQKGIIHRDLKPSNILVTVRNDHPEPKIIDFGVAKATINPLTERTLYTELGALIGTPEYMSPEQTEMTGLDVDTRTDVYALGVILYELLTGFLPFDARVLRERGLDSIRQTIREVDPSRPSTRVNSAGQASMEAALCRRTDPTRLASQLSGDLDWITIKCLEKDRTRRFGSVSDLAADLRRHLENEPVLASPPSTVYRARKFVRRHRIGVTAAATLVVLLAAFAGAMAVQARRIALERDRANREAETSKQVSDFLVGLFNISDPSEARGNTLTAREVLDKGAKEIERTLSAQPQVQARLQMAIGIVYHNLGLYSAAELMLQRAVATRRRLLGPGDLETLAAVEELASVYWRQARYGEAEPLYREVLEGRRRVLGEEHRDTLMAKFDLASLYHGMGRFSEAEQLERVTLEIQRRTLGADHAETLASMNNLGAILLSQGRAAEAAEIQVRVGEIRRRILGEDHPDTLRSMHNLAVAYSNMGRYDDAERLFATAINGRRRVLGDSHPLTILSVERLAGMYQKQRRYEEAESQLLIASRWLRENPNADLPTIQAVATRLVEVYEAWGKSEKAAEWQARLPKENPAKP
jgi:eukaryotic-like serine/threonine-protein kinase